MSILAYFLLKTIDSIVGSVQSVCQRAVSLDAERRFATTLFAHVQALGASYHLERHAGEVLRVLNRGGDAASTFIDSLWFGLFPTLFEAGVVGTVLARVLGVPSIAMTTLLSVCLYLTYTAKMTDTGLDQRRRVNDKNEAVGRIEAETLVNYENPHRHRHRNRHCHRHGHGHGHCHCHCHCHRHCHRYCHRHQHCHRHQTHRRLLTLSDSGKNAQYSGRQGENSICHQIYLHHLACT
jgi:hypothetical protein